MIEKKIWGKNFPQNVILDSAREKCFDKPGKKSFPEGRNIFTQFTKMKKWNVSFHLNISAKKVGMDT